MRLVACSSCHIQYDVSDTVAETIRCRCGESLDTRPHEPLDAVIARCGACGAQVQAESEGCAYCGSAIVRDSGRLSLICPECYARCADDARFCTACGIGFEPQKVEIEGVELPCPACGVLMPPRQLAGLGLNECATCNGLWVSDESFERLVSRAIEARRSGQGVDSVGVAPRVTGSNPAAQAVRYRKCPICEAFMQRRNFRKSSGVILDVCGEHGTWLEADELEQIAGFILSGGTTARCLEVEPIADRAERKASAAFARIQAQHLRVTPEVSSDGAERVLSLITRLLT
jgi:Zn-finger nucleic acid-binding protein